MVVNLAKTKMMCGTLVAAALAAGMIPAPAAAQVDSRLERIESQVRALQRAVFPGGDERFFEPEITPNSTRPDNRPEAGAPSASALTDVLARLDAIETQLARLTASTEVNQNALNLLETRLNEMEGSLADAQASRRPTGAIPLPGDDDDDGEELAAIPSGNSGTPATGAGPTPARVAAVQAIAKPATADAGDDEYSYGYRLWEAGFYPEAQQQLASFVEDYPAHWRTTFGRNLLGRAYLDAGNPRRAAEFFLENYQADKNAERAPDSLLYLAESMIKLGDTRRACIALAEFGDTYAALATGRLQTQYVTNRGRVDCE